MIARSGIGYDVHQFVEGRPLVLGGIAIPHSHGLLGHSDADVLLHAITDALLGAAALGDIGQHFPPSDERWRNESSLVFLKHAADLLHEHGYAIANLDATVIAEAPKIGPFSLAIRTMISTALGLPLDSISLKATTNEGMGFVGRREGIAALAIASIYRETR
jgi:2-C-methyl-D-erythritol 2,4-cyclodiphosphate synthase